VVINNGKVLLVRRGNEPGRGKFSIPGGMVEASEDPRVAVVRELKEETGLKGEGSGLVSSLHFSFPLRRVLILHRGEHSG
jgi:ADP-ribose pyrophosphatase YjhB (NUDIX family)